MVKPNTARRERGPEQLRLDSPLYQESFTFRVNRAPTERAGAVHIVRRFRPAPTGRCRAWAYSCLPISTEISTAGIVPLFSSQCVVFLSSGQPTPGP